MLEEHVTSIPEYVKTVLKFRDCCFPDARLPEVWFRGVNDASLQLLPGAYWRSECDEQSLVLSFRSLVPSYIQKEPLDDWEWYYLMQHYGLPTRLLDWSESPLVALYFALERESPGRVPCVWMMDPVRLNQASYGPEKDLIIVPFGTDTSETQYWLPKYCGSGKLLHSFIAGSRFSDNSKPLALFPKRHNSRIVAQRGVFTIHGAVKIPIEELLTGNDDDGTESIARITIEAGNRQQLLDDLWTFGINKAALFPEPQSVAEDLKRQYGAF